MRREGSRRISPSCRSWPRAPLRIAWHEPTRFRIWAARAWCSPHRRCCIVRGANGQQLAYVYYENEPGRRIRPQNEAILWCRSQNYSPVRSTYFSVGTKLLKMEKQLWQPLSPKLESSPYSSAESRSSSMTPG